MLSSAAVRCCLTFLLATLQTFAVLSDVTHASSLREPSPRSVSGPAQVLRCLAYSPYVTGYDPNTGPHPPHSLIDTLLDRVIHQARFRCVMIYGVLNGLDYIVQAAAQRGIQVVMILWLDSESPNDPTDLASINQGIAVAKLYPQTVIRVSCGSEYRTRHGTSHDDVILNCITRLRAAGVTRPIASIDTWWEWCNRSWPCQPWSLTSDVDWIGINIFPWWENKYSGLFPCTTAAQAAAFHLARYQDITNRYPGKPVIVTEFGWPAGPAGYTEENQFTHQRCGVASEANQYQVLESTLRLFDQHGISATVFEAFREPWKVVEGPVGPFWGICAGTSPYTCPIPYGFRFRVALPLVRRP